MRFEPVMVEVEPNPNCAEGCEQRVFNPLGLERGVEAVMVDRGRGDVRCEVTGVEAGGAFVPARARKVNDSSDGSAFLILGGAWGIRLKEGGSPWDLEDSKQWGEPYKLYGSEADIVFSEGVK